MDGDKDPKTEDFVLVEDPDQARALEATLDWLTPTDYDGDGSEYRKHVGIRAPGTGDWLFEHDDFKVWSSSTDRNLLWIKGVPGSGKSILASSVIEHLRSTEGSIVAYFFFRRIISTNCTFASMVRDIIAQIAALVPNTRQLVKKFMETHSNVDSISKPELWKLFLSVVGTLPRVYLVVDAWDEMLPGEESSLATTLLELASASTGSIKLLITSRPLSLLETLIRDFNPLTVRLSNAMIGPDVSTYIKYRLQTQSQRSHTTEEQDFIHETLSMSLFLHASLTLDEIVKSLTPVHELLQRIPSSLADLYSSVLRQYAAELENGEKMQRLLLPWVLHCFRPLRLVELAHVALFYELFDDISAAKVAIRRCCGPLLEIRKDETVHVCHHSFAEFLLDSDFIDIEDDEGGFTQVHNVGSHKTLAITCLRYLLSGILTSVNVEGQWGRVSRDQLEKDAFLQYSSQYWQDHVARVSTPDDEVFKLLDSLLQDDSHELKAWTKISKISKALKASDLKRLHFAAHFGLTAYVEYLLLNGLDVNCQANKLGRTALMFAIERGHEETAITLLGHGASTESTDIRGMSPIHLAVVGNHVKCLEVLIVSGADPARLIGPDSDETFESLRFLLRPDNDSRQFSHSLTGRFGARDTSRRLAGCSAIELACSMGFDEVAEVLLPLFDTETRASISLNWAAEGGHADVLRTLLEYPEIRENINSKNQEGSTALFAACRVLKAQAIKVLLSYGADHRISCTDSAGRDEFNLKRARNDIHEGLTPLHAWAGLAAEATKSSQGTTSPELPSCRDYISIGEMLLERGADPNAVTSQGQTALFQWSKKTTADECQSLFVSLLLRYGANPAATDKLGATPLHMMTGLKEELPQVELLVAAGADINAARTDGRSPLHMIFDQRDARPTSLHGLEKLRAYFNQHDENGDTPLHLAIKCWSKKFGPHDIEASLVELLKYSDVTIANNIGETALFNVLPENNRELSKMMIHKLLGSGANLEARNNDGRTVLLEACRFRDASISEFLSLDAKSDAQDVDGKGCLHLLLGTPAYDSNVFAPKTRDMVRLVSLLTTYGTRPNTVDKLGNTIYHEAASNAELSPFRETESLRGLKALLQLRYIGPNRMLQDRVNYLGQSPIHSAARRRPKVGPFVSNTDAVEVLWFDFLLSPEVGLQPNATDLAGVTPLHLAAPICEARVWRLLEAGADAACPAKNGRVPLHEAATGNANSVAILCQKMMEAGSSLDFTDDNGETPLHEAARTGNLQAVKILVKSGADTTRTNNEGLTALQIAISMHLETSDGDVESMAAESVMESYQRRRSYYAHRGNLFGYHDKSFGIFMKQLEKPDPLGIASFLSSHDKPTIPILSRAKASGTGEAAAEGESTNAAIMNSGGQQNANAADHDQESDESDGKMQMLLVAFLKRQNELITDILKSGVDLTEPIFYHDESILHTLVRGGCHTVLEVMAPFIKHINDIKPPLLHVAVDRKEINVDVMELLLDIGADPNRTYKNIPNASRVGFLFPKPYDDHTVMQKLATGHFWWHSRALRLLATRGGDLTTANIQGWKCIDLCETDERRNIKAGPYGRLCKEVITEIDPIPELEYNPMTDLIPAIMRGDLEAARAMLEAGTDPNARYERESNGGEILPLKACGEAWEQSILDHEQGHEEIPDIMALLLKHGADPYLEDAFHDVCANNAPVKPFLDAGADINARGCSGTTPLLSACSWYGYVPQGLRDIFALDLISAGADVNVQDENGQTPLHKTILSECHMHTPQIVDALLGAGADTSLKDNEGHDAFSYLIRQDDDDGMYSKHEMAYDFLDRGADALGVRDGDGQNNLHMILRNLGSLENSSSTTSELEYLVKTFQVLLDKAGDRNVRDAKGKTPVFCFVEAAVKNMPNQERRGLEWYRQFLKEFDVRAIDNAGETLLHVVARGRPNLLVGRGICQDQEGVELFGLLVEMGVDPTAENGEGLSSLDVAASHDRQDILKLFADND